MRRDDATAAVQRMTNVMLHRGPDDGGDFVSPADGVALGFRRLAIIDLTPLGHQPMASPTGRFHIVFNGEIYNHHELRRALQAEGVVFRGRSDTEALCAGFERWGVRTTLERAHGMFGIAAWDGERRVLTLARDRIGIKPVHVYAQPGFVSFGSEPKVLAAGPHFSRQLNSDVVEDYLALEYVPGPHTIWRGMQKLGPGMMLEISDPSLPLPEATPYWSMEQQARNGRLSGNTLSEAEAGAEVERVIRDAVSSHLESDVPLGAFLSGGIDSSTIVALMQEMSSTPVRTFTIRFDDPVHDEADHAEAVARHLGTDHTTIDLAGDDALDLVPRLPEFYDEPFADSSQLPTLLVSQAARRHVTVVLTGDGGDELFAGYNRYAYGIRSLARIGQTPALVRHGLASMIDAAPAGSIDSAVRGVGAVLPKARSLRLAEEKARKFGRLLRGDSVADRYMSLLSNSNRPTGAGRVLPEPLRRAFEELPPETALLDRMLLADQLSYLPDNQMTKVDRASMAVSLEARVPLLDHRVAELAWRLPVDWLLRGGMSKWALRDVVYRRIPRTLLERPKMGFSVPLGGWLRGPLRAWAEDLLRPDLVKQGPLDVAHVTKAASRLWAGHDDAAAAVWACVQFESWRRRWLS